MTNNPPTIPTLGLAEQLTIVDDEKDDLERIIKLLLDKENIAHNTELTRNEITAFSILRGLAQKHNITVLQTFLDENLSLRVSKGRQGRKEWVKMIAMRGMQNEEDEQGQSRVGRFFKRSK